MTIGGTIAAHASANPDGAAIRFENECISWRELDELTLRLAGCFRRHARDGAIAILLPQSPALAIAFLAAARAGYEAQVFDTSWPEAVARDVLNALQPALIVASADAFAAAPCRVQISLPNSSLSALRAMHSDGLAPQALPPIDPETIFYTGFTSGSTGQPKGYRRTHRSWLLSFDAANREFGLARDDVVLAPGTLTHSLFLFALAYSIHMGSTCVLLRTFRPARILRLARAHKASILFAVPSQLGLMARHAEQSDAPELPAMRRVISSGAKWLDRRDPALRKLFPRARFSEFYGSSEASFVSIAHDNEDVPDASVGRAFDGVDISIRDAGGRNLPPGETGRIFVRSGMVFAGYAGPSRETPFHADGALCTGDIGAIDAPGNLFLSGRENRMIIISGKNLFPEEVERVLEEHPAVRNSAVLGAPDAKRGERLLAFIQCTPGASIKRGALIAHARRRLPLFKIPRRFEFIPDWPVTRSGKTDFAALEKLVPALTDRAP